MGPRVGKTAKPIQIKLQLPAGNVSDYFLSAPLPIAFLFLLSADAEPPGLSVLVVLVGLRFLAFDGRERGWRTLIPRGQSGSCACALLVRACMSVCLRRESESE